MIRTKESPIYNRNEIFPPFSFRTALTLIAIMTGNEIARDEAEILAKSKIVSRRSFLHKITFPVGGFITGTVLDRMFLG